MSGRDGISLEGGWTSVRAWIPMSGLPSIDCQEAVGLLDLEGS
jgi:hypothetical protein